MSVFLRASLLAAIAAIGVTAWTSSAHASAPMGVYARVDSVTFEPDKATATKVKIHGVFAVHQGGSGFDYSAPAAGYMYFTCPAGKETECRDQWVDLEGYAGNKTTCAGFGQQEKGFGTVVADGVAAQPETYDLGIGVQPGQYVGGTCPKLLAYTPPANSSSGAGSNGGTTSGGTTTPPGNTSGDGTPDETTSGSPSNPSPPPAPSSSSSCAATPGATGSALAFAAVIGAIVGFLARRRRS